MSKIGVETRQLKIPVATLARLWPRNSRCNVESSCIIVDAVLRSFSSGGGRGIVMMLFCMAVLCILYVAERRCCSRGLVITSASMRCLREMLFSVEDTNRSLENTHFVTFNNHRVVHFWHARLGMLQTLKACTGVERQQTTLNELCFELYVQTLKKSSMCSQEPSAATCRIEHLVVEEINLKRMQCII